jgi:cytochrome P450
MSLGGSDTVRVYLEFIFCMLTFMQNMSSHLSFFLAMTLYPEIQKRAQEEIDLVIGDRLPCIADRERLPYTEALMAEILRWAPPAPIGKQMFL